MAKTDKKLTDDPVVLRILGLLEKKRKKELDLSRYLKISSGSVSKWKYDGSVVYLKYIEEICDFLDTTPNYLFLGSDDEERISMSEKKLLKMYRKLDDDRKQCINDTIRFMTKR